MNQPGRNARVAVRIDDTSRIDNRVISSEVLYWAGHEQQQESSRARPTRDLARPQQALRPSRRQGGAREDAPVKAPAATRRNPKTHQAVLAAAEELLKEIGYTSITIDRIAERSGVAKASIYRWWPNKAAVFMELYITIVSKARMPVDTGTLEGDLRDHARTAFRVFRTTVAGLALAGFVADAQSNPKTHQLLQEGIATHIRKVNMALLERARERGELNPWVSTAVAADVMSGALYYQLLIRGGQFTNAEADQITDLILRGIRAEAA